MNVGDAIGSAIQNNTFKLNIYTSHMAYSIGCPSPDLSKMPKVNGRYKQNALTGHSEDAFTQDLLRLALSLNDGLTLIFDTVFRRPYRYFLIV